MEKPTIDVGPGGLEPEHYCLHVISGSSSAVHVLPANGRATIGRSSECEVKITDKAASRKHATLHVGTEVIIEDLGSKNGTIVRRKRLAPHQTMVLSTGDVIEVGDTMLVLQPAASTPERPIAEPGGTSSAEPAAPVQGFLERLDPLVARLAASDLTVLVLGETGVGKEMASRLIHDRSPRRDKPFVAINCAALPEALLESELFGHERGAFTGAARAKTGLLESAAGGTVLLDEIGEMPASVQAKLLRVLDTREVLRIGSVAPRAVDVRFLAATNRDLKHEVHDGHFRRDLYFRLNGFTLIIPPLRLRLDEVPRLATLFAGAMAARLGRIRTPHLGRSARDLLEAHDWPGNIRELKNVVERAVVLCSDDEVLPEHLHMDAAPAPAARAAVVAPPPASRSDDDAERARIAEALRLSAGNQSRAALRLGISRKTLIKRIIKLDLPRPRKGQPDDDE